MDPPAYARAVRAAQALLLRHRVRTAPIHVAALARTLGFILCQTAEDEHVCGALLRGDGGPAIHVNPLHAETRQRFIIAHELGHFHLHKGDFVDPDANVRLQFRRKGAAPTYCEAEANAFAAELLMPAGLLAQHVVALRHPIERLQGGLNRLAALGLVEQLAQKYAVETQVMGCRLVHLKLVNVHLLRGAS